MEKQKKKVGDFPTDLVKKNLGYVGIH